MRVPLTVCGEPSGSGSVHSYHNVIDSISYVVLKYLPLYELEIAPQGLGGECVPDIV